MPTITGTNNDIINAACSVAADHAEINQTESSATAQSIVNDLAAIRDSTTVGLPSKADAADLVAAKALVQTDQTQTNTTNTSYSVSYDGSFHDTSFYIGITGGCQVGDVVRVWLGGMLNINTQGSVRIRAIQDYGGANTAINGTTLTYSVTQQYFPLDLFEAFTIAVAGPCRIVVQLSSSNAVYLEPSQTMMVTRTRTGI